MSNTQEKSICCGEDSYEMEAVTFNAEWDPKSDGKTKVTPDASCEFFIVNS